jgi:hypothetical protein
MNASAYAPAAAVLQLNDEQLAQQADLARRILNMAYLGTPRVLSDDPNTPALLALHAVSTAYMAMAEANPGITDSAGQVAFDMSHHLRALVEKRAATAH